MDITDFYKDERLQWLRYVLNPSGEMPTVRDWHRLLKFANKQALTGILLPTQRPENLDRDLLLNWFGTCQLIEVLEGGNFGQYSLRYHGKDGFYYRGMMEAWRMAWLMDTATREVMARLVSKMKTALRHTIKIAK